MKKVIAYVSGFVKSEKGFNPSIEITSQYSNGPYIFDNVIEETEQKARAFATFVIGDFRNYMKDNKEKFDGIVEWGVVAEAMDFFKKRNAKPIYI